MSKPINKITRFSDWKVVGHKTQIEYLKSNINSEDLSHAYLFTGEEKIGKRLIALSFVKSLLCNSEIRFCGKCPSCNQIEKGIHPDVSILEGTSAIKIEEIRELVSKVSLKPFNADFKVAIIDNAERLTLEAANALLKTLEEPSGKAILILITKDSSILLPTIVSRLRVIKFFKVSEDSILEILSHSTMSLDKKNLITKIVMGKPGNALEMLQNPKELTDFSDWCNQFADIIKQEKYENLTYSSKLAKLYSEEPEKIIRMLSFWVIILRDIINSKNIKNYKGIAHNFLEKDVFKNINTNSIICAINQINSTIEILSNPSSGFNNKLIFDLIVLKLGKIKS